jgi:[protein-PII] uridylyltransferase
MDQVVNQREIIDRRTLIVALDAVAADEALSAEAKRAKLRDLVKAGLAAGSGEIRTRFENGTGGIATVRAQCFLVDQIIRIVHDYAERHIYRISNPTQAERLAIVAVGGYGRGELAPHSDIDLLFLRPYKQTPRGEQLVEFLLYMLWDLGLKVGHATRSVDECLRLAREDLTIRTALLESRYLWGDDKLYAEFRQKFISGVVKGTGAEFVAAKLAERNERHKRLITS